MHSSARSLLSLCARALTVLLCTSLCMTAFADPPEHAKAHGWRKKHDPRYVGYTGREWPRDYGIVQGHCNRDEIGTVLGAVLGGAVGSQVGDGSGRTVAIVVGTVLGAVIGREIGRDLDDRDRACVGHSLELMRDGQSVRWTNDQTRVSYVLTPLAASKDDAKKCRKFNIKASLEGKAKSSAGRACRNSEGTWSIVS
jgi:surface antigen